MAFFLLSHQILSVLHSMATHPLLQLDQVSHTMFPGFRSQSTICLNRTADESTIQDFCFVSQTGTCRVSKTCDWVHWLHRSPHCLLLLFEGQERRFVYHFIRLLIIVFSFIVHPFTFGWDQWCISRISLQQTSPSSPSNLIVLCVAVSRKRIAVEEAVFLLLNCYNILFLSQCLPPFNKRSSVCVIL